MRVCSLESLFHLLEKIFDLILYFLLKGLCDLFVNKEGKFLNKMTTLILQSCYYATTAVLTPHTGSWMADGPCNLKTNNKCAII